VAQLLSCLAQLGITSLPDAVVERSSDIESIIRGFVVTLRLEFDIRRWAALGLHYRCQA
jgi:hypothetical protein